MLNIPTLREMVIVICLHHPGTSYSGAGVARWSDGSLVCVHDPASSDGVLLYWGPQAFTEGNGRIFQRVNEFGAACGYAEARLWRAYQYALWWRGCARTDDLDQIIDPQDNLDYVAAYRYEVTS